MMSHASPASSPSTSLPTHSPAHNARLQEEDDFASSTNCNSYFASDASEDIFDTTMEQQDVSVVMGEALFHLERIAEHLREKGSNGAANEIAKNAISILNIFNDAIADWDIEKCLMTATSAITKHAAGAVRGDAILMKNAETIEEHVKKIKGCTWASVAATATHHGNRIVKFRPVDGITRTITEDSMTTVRPQDARVVWIKPWNPEKKKLSDITEKIDQGPLFSIAHSQADEAVCVIFQHAHHARAFLEANARHTRMLGQGPFGPDCEVLEGQAYPASEDIRRMDIKNERRRLTFARCRLFTNGMTEARFKTDIFGMVGEGNVELVWLFNSGNATVVFSATAIARTVREEFLSRAACPGPYQDVMVSFSHDPCERPLNLITQMPGSRSVSGTKPNNGNSDGGSNGSTNSSRLTEVLTASLVGDQRAVVDAEGWQTVGKRK